MELSNGLVKIPVHREFTAREYINWRFSVDPDFKMDMSREEYLKTVGHWIVRSVELPPDLAVIFKLKYC